MTENTLALLMLILFICGLGLMATGASLGAFEEKARWRHHAQVFFWNGLFLVVSPLCFLVVACANALLEVLL